MSDGKAKEFFKKYADKTQGRVRMDVSMASYTTFRCHGTADVVYNPRNREDLSFVLEKFKAEGFEFRKDWLVIGRGSNVLVADEGFRGCMIDLSTDFTKMDVLKTDPETISLRVEAGVSNGTLLQYLRNKNWSGFEFAFGIPGSVGGGIRMNAGTPQGWFQDVLEGVELMDLDGKIKTQRVYPYLFSYRDFPLAHNHVVISGDFHFYKSPHFVIEEKIEAVKNQRKNQPLEYPNIGSVFKNPPGLYAGRLIEEAGLKGVTQGDAKVSKKHANFIINRGSAKTKDVLDLIEKIKRAVHARSGILLEEEVHILGMEKNI